MLRIYGALWKEGKFCWCFNHNSTWTLLFKGHSVAKLGGRRMHLICILKNVNGLSIR